MSDTFYCGKCGDHKRSDFLASKTVGGHCVCISCEERILTRDKKRKEEVIPGVTGEMHERAVKRRRADRYKKGKLPKFMYR